MNRAIDILIVGTLAAAFAWWFLSTPAAWVMG